MFTRPLAWVLLFWLVVPIGLPVFIEPPDSTLSPGIFDDDDDDGSVIAALSSPGLKLVALIPLPPPEPVRVVEDPAPIPADPVAAFLALTPGPPRSPPLS